MNNLLRAMLSFIESLMRKFYPPEAPVVLATPPPVPISNITATPAIEPPVAPEPLLWDTPKRAYRSVRILCDELGLVVTEKNEICATIYGESEFKNTAVCINRDTRGKETSRDVGLCQWNSYWHTGEGKTFPSTEYVVAHPEEAVRKMIAFYKSGHINLWVAHKSGRYLQFLKPNSPMWSLKS